MLLTSPLSSETTRRAVEAIYRSARAQTVLVNDMLEMSRIVSGKMALTRRAVDVTSIIDSAIDTVRAAADAKGVRLTKDFRCEPITLGILTVFSRSFGTCSRMRSSSLRAG